MLKFRTYTSTTKLHHLRLGLLLLLTLQHMSLHPPSGRNLVQPGVNHSPWPRRLRAPCEGLPLTTRRKGLPSRPPVFALCQATCGPTDAGAPLRRPLRAAVKDSISALMSSNGIRSTTASAAFLAALSDSSLASVSSLTDSVGARTSSNCCRSSSLSPDITTPLQQLRPEQRYRVSRSAAVKC